MKRLAAWLLCLLSLTVALPARAQSDAATTAVELARQAKGKYDQGEWRGALELFEQAEAKAHSPVLVLYAARCRRNLGELVAAKQLFKQVAEEPLGPDAAAPFKQARDDAAADLEAVSARIPILVIDRAKAPPTWQVTVDGVAVTEPEVAVDPGRHVVRAGSGAFEREVVVEEGKRVTVAIAGGATTPAPGPDPVPPPVEADSGGFASSIGPGLIALGLGAAGVGVGVGLRVVALQKVSDVKDRCVDNQCLAEDASEIESAETLQNVSTVLFAVGGAAMATGIVLMIVLPEDDPAPSVALDLRPGYLGLSGTF